MENNSNGMKFSSKKLFYVEKTDVDSNENKFALNGEQFRDVQNIEESNQLGGMNKNIIVIESGDDGNLKIKHNQMLIETGSTVQENEKTKSINENENNENIISEIGDKKEELKLPDVVIDLRSNKKIKKTKAVTKQIKPQKKSEESKTKVLKPKTKVLKAKINKAAGSFIDLDIESGQKQNYVEEPNQLGGMNKNIIVIESDDNGNLKIMDSEVPIETGSTVQENEKIKSVNENYESLSLEEEAGLDQIISIQDYNTDAKKSNKLILPQFSGCEGFINQKTSEVVYIKLENDDLEKARDKAFALLATKKNDKNNDLMIEINTTQKNSTTESQAKKTYSLRRIEDRKNKEIRLISKKTCRPFIDKEYEVLKKHLHCDIFKRLKLKDKIKSETPKLSESKESKTKDKRI